VCITYIKDDELKRRPSIKTMSTDYFLQNLYKIHAASKLNIYSYHLRTNLSIHLSILSLYIQIALSKFLNPY